MPIDIESIYQDVRRDIIDLILFPNSQIKEEVLADNYHVSRTPVRSAVSRLVQEGLLVVVPKKGTYVSKININNIKGDLFIREAVEAKVLKEAASVIKKQDIVELKEILEEQRKIAEMPPSIHKSRLFNKNDNLFHRRVFEILKLGNLWDTIDSHVSNFNRVRLISNLRDSLDVKEVYFAHVKILEFLSKKDGTNATIEFDKHLNLALNGIEVVIDKFKDYFVGGE